MVISTSSPHNLTLLKDRGADHVFDHSDPTTIKAIQSLFPIDYWFDTISLKPSVSTILKILAPDGKPVTEAKLVVLLPPVMFGITEFSKGITVHRFLTHSPENADWNKYFLAPDGFLEKAIKSEVLKGVPAEVVGGLESVADGIDQAHVEMSDKKIVVELWAWLCPKRAFAFLSLYRDTTTYSLMDTEVSLIVST
jgi:NADPH:quinone reductase-like Zn-dependent oxidoreductase